jgi:hypothetical protein
MPLTEVLVVGLAAGLRICVRRERPAPEHHERSTTGTAYLLWKPKFDRSQKRIFELASRCKLGQRRSKGAELERVPTLQPTITDVVVARIAVCV